MTESFSKDGLLIAAWTELKFYVTKPSMYQHHGNLYQFAQSLWMVYLCRCGEFASFDEFYEACKSKASIFRKQIERKKR